MSHTFLSQFPYTCKLDWGVLGAKRAAERGEVILIVDVYSFSTTVAYAAARGASVIPCGKSDNPVEIAKSVGGTVVVNRRDVPTLGKYSLSPETMLNAQPGEKIILPSRNGANCSRAAQGAPHVIAGAFVNLKAVGECVNKLLETEKCGVTIIACGEREKEDDHQLRVAIEDYLAAGAIVSMVKGEKSPEAEVCEGAYLSRRSRLKEILWESTSSRELREAGFARDVELSIAVDAFSIVPLLRKGAYSG